MKINSINSVLSLNYKNFAQNNNQVTNPLVNEKLPISDNYGRAMVNFKASGAKNIKNAVLKAPLEDKVSAIVQTLQQDELLIISSNLRKSLEMFKENLRVLDFPVKKILHIQEPRLSEILAFTLQDDYGNVKIYNVNEEPIEIIDSGIPLILDQGERQTLGLGGIVKSSLGNIMLKGESDSVGNDDIEKYMSLFTKEIDFDNQMTLTTLQHNKLIFSLETAENLLQNKVCDLIGLGRPLIAEPDLPLDWRKGKERLSCCAGCNGCFRPLVAGRGVACRLPEGHK